MIIVPISGGLGNQMFPYGLYRRLLADGKDVYMDIYWYENDPYCRYYELSKVFHINERLASKEQIKKVRRNIREMNIFQRIYRKSKIFLLTFFICSFDARRSLM